jgi:hypothetical protein
MAAPFSVCTKEKLRSVIRFFGLKVYQGPKSIEDFQHSTGTVFCLNGVSTNGLKSSKMVAQVLHMKKEPDAHPRPQLMTILSVYVTWFC